MAVSDLTLSTKIKEVEERIQIPEEMLGNTLMMPFAPSCSAQRKIMFAQHVSQHLNLTNGEIPLVGTGYEDEFGRYSSSYNKTKSDYIILGKIDKFSNHKGMHYFTIIQDIDTGEISMVERVSYKHTTEAFGFMLDNRGIDNFTVGSTIPAGTVIQKSTSYDEFDGHCDGVNLLTTYLAMDPTMEDSIVISESAKRKLSSPTIKTVSIIINDNDILLNLYGDNNNYKAFPDLNEEIKDGIVCAIRREKKEESLFTQTYPRLQDIMMSDDKYTMNGKVIDVNVYCNNPDALQQSYYNSQIRDYYNDNIRFCREFIACIDQYPQNPKHIEVQKLYTTCQRILRGDQFIRDKPFSNIILELVVFEENEFCVGDKLSNRFGGKGVVSEIKKDEDMPLLDNGDRVELIFNSSTCVNRLNPGQLFEMSLTFCGQRILEFMSMNVLDVGECIDMYARFMNIVNPEECKYVLNTIENLDEENVYEFLASMVEDKGIRFSMAPISNSLSIDTIAKIYEEFPWIKQYTLTVPMKDSNGNVRYVNSRRPIVAGRQYIYRLKQYAEEKFSVTSLSATNTKNENSRNKANKSYRTLFTKTPIRFGEMETGDLLHLGAEFVVVNLMLYSTSPNARRLTESLLTGDPFSVDIKLDSNSRSRNVEILNAYLKTMGLKLVFVKRMKKSHKAFVTNPFKHVYADKVPQYMRNPFIHCDGQYIDPDYYQKLYDIEHSGKEKAFITNPFQHLSLEYKKHK